MSSLYTRLYVLSASATLMALPMLDIHVYKYLKSLEFRQFVAQSVVTPLVAFVADATVMGVVQRVFGVI
jgi:hypothetical protein